MDQIFFCVKKNVIFNFVVVVFLPILYSVVILVILKEIQTKVKINQKFRFLALNIYIYFFLNHP